MVGILCGIINQILDCWEISYSQYTAFCSEEVRHACTNHYKFSALMSLRSRDNAWPQCTELVVIRTRMSDLLCFCIYTILETTPLLLKRKVLESCSVESCPVGMQLHVMCNALVILLQPREQTTSDVLILEADIFCASAWAVAHDYL